MLSSPNFCPFQQVQNNTFCKPCKLVRPMDASCWKSIGMTMSSHIYIQHYFYGIVHEQSYYNCNWCSWNLLYVNVVYQSIDTVPDQNAVTDPTKFLNSLELSGKPPHILKLKVGAPAMVLQNINPLYLCNSTRCIVRILGAIALKWQLQRIWCFSAMDSLNTL